MLRIKGKRGYSTYYVQCKILFSSKTTIRIQLDLFLNLPIFYCRFAIFRRCRDAEMKDSMQQGMSLQSKKKEKEAVTEEKEEKSWSAGLFGSGIAKQLLDTINLVL